MSSHADRISRFAGDKRSSPSLASSAKEKIDAVVQAQPARDITPRIAVAIAKNGQTIYGDSANVRDVASHAQMLVTTPQAIGSITKQFTAAAILLLQQQKKLSIDDKLSKFVPEYVHADEITLRQMLARGAAKNVRGSNCVRFRAQALR
jgi:D-alanyl-D-alanine carboxypeptidase